MILATFNAVDQTFFMALFYWMAGYFSHLELVRRGTSPIARRSFVRARVSRLVVPSIFFTVALEPMLKIMAMHRYCSLDPDHCERTNPIWMAVKTLVGYWFGGGIKGINGPVWFCMLLAIFDTLAALFVLKDTRRGSKFSGLHKSLILPKYLSVILFMVIVTTYVIRILYPAGTVFRLLNIQPAFLPQYVFAYLVGHASAAGGSSNLRFAGPGPWPHPYVSPLKTLAGALTVQTVTLGLVMGSAYLVMGSAYLVKEEWDSPLNYLVGGFNIPALFYTIWDEVGFLSIGPALVDLFARIFNKPFSVRLPWRPFTIANSEVTVARYAFATFLVHPPVSMAVELLAESLMGCKGVDSRLHDFSPPSSSAMWNTLGPVFMTAVIGSVNVVLSWTAAFGLLDLLPDLAQWV